MTEPRQVAESPLTQGKDEVIVYKLATSNWGSSPTGVEVKLFDVTAGAYSDVSVTSLSGAATVSGDEITLPAVQALSAGHDYRLEIKFTSGANTFECWLLIHAEN